MKTLKDYLKEQETSTNSDVGVSLSEDSVNEDYKGWTYNQDVEEYEDNRKIFHSATKDGKEVSMDWSPYSTPTDEEFKLWVDLGMPTRKAVNGIGPLDKDDLLQLAKTKQGTHNLLQRESKVKETVDILRLSGVISEDQADELLKKVTDPKTRVELLRTTIKNKGQAKGDPLAALAIELSKEIERLDQENDIEDAQIAAQDVVDKQHTDDIIRLKHQKKAHQ